MQMQLWLTRRQSFHFDVFPFHPAGPAGAQCFKRRFLRCKSRGVMNLWICAFLAVLHLPFCIYSIEKTVAESLDRIANAFVLNDVNANAGDHMDLCYR